MSFQPQIRCFAFHPEKLTPMTVFDTFGIVSGITNGHVPLAYLLALGAMLPKRQFF
jgi:hypothetical protein